MAFSLLPPPGIVLILAGRSSAGIPPVICFPRFVCIRKKALPTDNTLVISLFCFGQQMEPSPPPISHSPAATWQTHSAIFRRSADFRSAFFHVHPSENSISTFKESIGRKNGAPKRSVRAMFRKKRFLCLCGPIIDHAHHRKPEKRLFSWRLFGVMHTRWFYANVKYVFRYYYQIV